MSNYRVMRNGTSTPVEARNMLAAARKVATHGGYTRTEIARAYVSEDTERGTLYMRVESRGGTFGTDYHVWAD